MRNFEESFLSAAVYSKMIGLSKKILPHLIVCIKIILPVQGALCNQKFTGYENSPLRGHKRESIENNIHHHGSRQRKPYERLQRQ